MFKYGIIGMMSLFLTETTINPGSRFFELSKENAAILISGTSTLHDWKMYLKVFDCNANFIEEESQLKGIDEVTFTCRTTDLKSDNSLMDKKAYSALKSGSFPEIKFNMISAMEISPDNNKFSNVLRGNLFIAGKSISVLIPINGSLSNINGINRIDVSGETELKMSDFAITPPTAMMGALKTDDRITVSFTLQFLQKPVK
ncbi:MAG: YceI family protein [Bacteroidales bacterium]